MDENIDITKLSDTYVMQKMLQEKLNLNISNLVNLQERNRKPVPDDEVEVLSSERFREMQAYWKETQKMLKLQRQCIPANQKILLIQALKVKEIDKMYGITPNDFSIYLSLNKIDMYGNQITFQEIEEGKDPGDDFSKGGTHGFRMPNRLLQTVDNGFTLEKLFDKLVISKDSQLYGIEQGLITLCCLISCYFYMYLAAFAQPENMSLVNMSFELCFAIDMLISFFVEYTPNQQTKNESVRKFSKIAKHYLSTTFFSELVPLLPL